MVETMIGNGTGLGVMNRYVVRCQSFDSLLQIGQSPSVLEENLQKQLRSIHLTQ